MLSLLASLLLFASPAASAAPPSPRPDIDPRKVEAARLLTRDEEKFLVRIACETPFAEKMKEAFERKAGHLSSGAERKALTLELEKLWSETVAPIPPNYPTLKLTAAAIVQSGDEGVAGFSREVAVLAQEQCPKRVRNLGDATGVISKMVLLLSHDKR